MDVYKNFVLACAFLLSVDSIKCSVSTTNLKEDTNVVDFSHQNNINRLSELNKNPENKTDPGNISSLAAWKPSAMSVYNFSDEGRLYNDDNYAARIEKALSKSKKDEHDSNAIEMKDFAAGSSESTSMEPKAPKNGLYNKPVNTDDVLPTEQSILPEQPTSGVDFARDPLYNYNSERWLQEDVSYANYITDVLGKDYFSKTNHRKETHTVSTVFHVPEEYSERKSDGQKDQADSPPIIENDDKFFEDFAGSTNFNSTFENQLEEPEKSDESQAEEKRVNSEAETEYYSLSAASASQETRDENCSRDKDRKLLSAEVNQTITANKALITEKTVGIENDLVNHQGTTKLTVDENKIQESHPKNEATVDEGTKKKIENNTLKDKTEGDKEIDSKKVENMNTSKNSPEQQKSPRIIQLVVPEHLANDPDRILNEADLERSYISRHFEFYNPDPRNRQSISSFINMIARESKGYEIRTARIRKRFFKALNDNEKKSFCEEHINGNIILRSKNLLYDEDANIESIKATRKTVVYRWKLPSENITTVRCPIKAKKAGVEAPSAVYLVPVIYDDEYKSPYTFVFTDCTPEDNCGPDEEHRAVRLMAISRVDVDYAFEKMKEKLIDVHVDEKQLNKEESEGKGGEPLVNDFLEKTKDSLENLGKKSLLQPEERKEVMKEKIAAKDLIDKYLKDVNDVFTLAKLRRVLTVDQYRMVQLKAAEVKQRTNQKIKEPWLVKMVKRFTGLGKKDKDTTKADFYVDKPFARPTANLVQVY